MEVEKSGKECDVLGGGKEQNKRREFEDKLEGS